MITSNRGLSARKFSQRFRRFAPIEKASLSRVLKTHNRTVIELYDYEFMNDFFVHTLEVLNKWPAFIRYSIVYIMFACIR